VSERERALLGTFQNGGSWASPADGLRITILTGLLDILAPSERKSMYVRVSEQQEREDLLSGVNVVSFIDTLARILCRQPVQRPSET
jgi:hypothetical protein